MQLTEKLTEKMKKMVEEVNEPLLRKIQVLEQRLSGDERGNSRSSSIPVEKISNKVGRFSCNIKPPPAQVETIHGQIIQMIQMTLQQQGYELQKDGRGPTLVTVVNASRTQEDIERDMIAANLSGSETSDVILLRIVPCLNQTKNVKKMSGEHFKVDLVFLAEGSAKKLLDCDENKEACEKFVSYLCNK